MNKIVFKPTLEQREFIFKNYIGLGNKELAEIFNKQFKTEVTPDRIKSFKNRNKLNSGLTGRFEKGHNPMNKGLTWDDYMSKESQKKSRRHTFKKGNISQNTKDIGTEFYDRDGYLYVKVKGTGPRFGRNGMWQQYHHLVWMQYYGEIPEDSVVIFLDQNKSNFDISNLKLVDRKELLILNRQGLIFQDSNLTNAGVSLAKLISKQKKLEKK